MIKYYLCLIISLLFLSGKYLDFHHQISSQFSKELNHMRANINKTHQKYKKLDKKKLAQKINNSLKNPHFYNPKR